MTDRATAGAIRAVPLCVAVIALVGGTTPVRARADAVAERPCTAYWNAAVVVAGRVDSIQRTSSGRRLTLAIVARFRTPAGGGVIDGPTVTLDVPSASPCASRFRAGQEYLVYADRVAGGLSLTRCSRTRALGDAAADVSYAQSVSDGSAPAGTINGRVVVSARDLAGRIAGPSVSVAGVAVRLSAGGQQDQTLTNHAGDFTLASRGAATQTLSVDVPPHYYSESTGATIDLREPRACADVEFRLAPDGRIAGRIVDAERRPLAGLTVELSTITLAQRRVAVTDRDGRYQLTRLPAGRFVVAVAAGAPPVGGQPSRVFLPGATTIRAAMPIAVAEGERVEAPEFRLPASVQYLAISGFVLDADGTPAEGAHVYVKGASEGDRIVGEPVAADFVGRFTIAVPAGTGYVIFAERTRGTRIDSSDQVRLALPYVGHAGQPIRLVLQRRY